MYTIFEGLQSQVPDPCCLTEPAVRDLERRNPTPEIIHGLRPSTRNYWWEARYSLRKYSDSLDLHPGVARAPPCASISTPRRTVLTAWPGNVSRASQREKTGQAVFSSGSSEAWSRRTCRALQRNHMPYVNLRVMCEDRLDETYTSSALWPTTSFPLHRECKGPHPAEAAGVLFNFIGAIVLSAKLGIVDCGDVEGKKEMSLEAGFLGGGFPRIPLFLIGTAQPPPVKRVGVQL